MTLAPLPKGFDYHLNPKEKEQIECIVPMHQAKIHLAFRANLVFDGKTYKNGVAALSEHTITVCSRAMLGKNLKLLAVFHMLDLKALRTISDECVEITTAEHSVTILSTTCMRFARCTLRNYILSAPLMPPNMRFKLQSHDPSQFPPFQPPLSPSQEFQFTYNANCSFYDSTYHHDVARYFHHLVSTGNAMFDLTQLPIDILEDALGEASDARPITASLCFCPYIYGFNCENISKCDIVKATAPIVLLNSNLRVLRLVGTGASEGCNELAKAMVKNESPGVVYWDLSDNQMDIIPFAEAIGVYGEPILSLKLRNCRIEAYAMEVLLNSLLQNQVQHGIKQLCLSGNDMNARHAQMLAELLKKDDCDDLNILEIGPVQSLDLILDALLRRADQVSHLRIIDTPITEKYEGCLVALLEQAAALRELDLSGCQISLAGFETVLATISHNRHIRNIALRFNHVDSRSLVMDVLRRSERKVQQLINVLEVDESLRKKIISLSLDENAIKEEEMKQMLPVIRNMPNLQELSLNGNFSAKTIGISDHLVQLLQIPNLEYLSVAGSDGGKMQVALLPFIKALRANTTLRRVDISNNEIGDAGLKLVTRLLRKSKTLLSISFDGSKPRDLSTIFAVLDAVGSSHCLMNVPYPIDDIYECVAELNGEARERAFETLTHLQSKMEVKLAKNGAKIGVFSKLTLLNDPILNDLISDMTVDVQEKLATVQVHKHLLVNQVVGLPMPHQADFVTLVDSKKVRDSGDDEGRELYVSKNFMESITDDTETEPDFEDGDLSTLRFNSLIIRRPDSQQKLLKKAKAFAPEFDASSTEVFEEEDSEEDDFGKFKPTTFEGLEAPSVGVPRWSSFRRSPMRKSTPLMQLVRKRLASSASIPPKLETHEQLNPSQNETVTPSSPDSIPTIPLEPSEM